ncbi:ATP-binding protein [Actinacidiphila alni]|uniref:ATP-binding protein n=1 Tax=Actinacidiphila alni TaxID=380248 RepID=UPI0033C058AE
MAAAAPAQPLDQTVVSYWPSAARHVPEARHELRATLSRWGHLELADAACVVLSELMTNSLKYAKERGRHIETRFVRLRDATGRPDGLRIEVHDADRTHPVLHSPAPDSESGRGLPLVDAITAGRWGTASRDGIGKLVWAEITASD